MIYRDFGKTGKKLSVLGLGAMRFGEDLEAGARGIRRAVELGVNYFDSAPAYARGESERVLGEALEEFKDKVYVGTKSSANEDPTADAVRRRIEDQLKLLRVDKIHFYFMWCVLNWERYERIIAPGGPYEGALKAKEEGLIEHILVSSHLDGEETARMLESGRFEGVLLGFNMLNFQFRQQAIDTAERLKVGVMVMNPLGGGLLVRAQEKFRNFSDGGPGGIVGTALRFCAAYPGINVVLSGMNNEQEVEENVKALERMKGVDLRLVKKVQQELKGLEGEFCTGCQYCLPHCPVGIMIPRLLTILDSYHVGIFRNPIGVYKMLREWFGEVEPGECTQCGACEEECPQHLPIRERIQEFIELMEKEAEEEAEKEAEKERGKGEK